MTVPSAGSTSPGPTSIASPGTSELARTSAGIPVAAQRAELPLFDRVLVDIGDEQSITADLSTFSAHMTNLRGMLEEATERSLVLVDEMGTGTAPEEGAALAVALLEEFRARRCLTIATTHHDRLKTYASTTAGVLNAAVEFDTVALRPTYRLMVGVPGVSSGIQIAERLGLPAPVLERARTEMSPQAREAGDLIAWLHRSRDELEEIKRQAAAQTLKQIAQESGGRYITTEGGFFLMPSRMKLKRIFTDLIDELHSQYTVAYEPNNLRRQGRWRTIRVNLEQADLTARTRLGYREGVQ